MSGSRARSARRHQGEDTGIEDAYAAIADDLERAMVATITERSAEPARAVVARITSIDDEMPDSEPPPGWTLTFLALSDWFDAARIALADQPDRVERSLGWIEERLGRRYRLRAAYTIAPLVSTADAAETTHYIETLGNDFLASMVWALAAVTDLYGDPDDHGWLRRGVKSKT